MLSYGVENSWAVISAQEADADHSFKTSRGNSVRPYFKLKILKKEKKRKA